MNDYTQFAPTQVGRECWLRFVRRRLNELHPLVFGPDKPEHTAALTYFAYHRELNRMGYGFDYAGHPRNVFELPRRR